MKQELLWNEHTNQATGRERTSTALDQEWNLQGAGVFSQEEDKKEENRFQHKNIF